MVGGHAGASLVVEAEVTSVGQYFRGEPDATFFLSLDSYLAQSEIWKRLPASRLRPWQYKGRQLLLPRDVNAVGLTYRADLFAQAGVDVEACATWESFFAACEKYEAYWAARGEPWRKAVEFPRGNASAVTVMLQQRGVPVVGMLQDVQLGDARVCDTLLAYAGWAATGVGANPARTILDTSTEVSEGRVAALLTADWRWGQLRKGVGPGVAAQLRTRGLPKFAEADAPTGTWGGTGIGIPRDTPSPLMSWRVIEALFADRERAERRWEETGVVPCVTSMWREGPLSRDPFAVLAARAPQGWRSTPVWPRAQFELNGIVGGACRRYAEGGRGAAAAWLGPALAEAQERLARELAQ